MHGDPGRDGVPVTRRNGLSIAYQKAKPWKKPAA
jgi:hypothetical protein